MMCGFNSVLYVVYCVLLVLLIAGLAFAIRFFMLGARYFQSKLDERQARKDHMNELLAKMDQLVDVLKVK
jgi:hypothetical protein